MQSELTAGNDPEMQGLVGIRRHGHVIAGGDSCSDGVTKWSEGRE